MLTFRLVNLSESGIKSVFQLDYEPTPCFHIQGCEFILETFFLVVHQVCRHPSTTPVQHDYLF